MIDTVLPPVLPTDESIAEAARRILARHDEAIYLSRLGQDLRAEFNSAFKIALGNRSLGDFVIQHLGDEYEVWGKGAHKRVGKHGTAATDASPRPRSKYHDAVWEAFIRPLPAGSRRWIDLGPPVTRRDAEGRPSGSDVVEVPAGYIVPSHFEGRERTLEIVGSIRRWAVANDIAPDRLEDNPDQPGGKDVTPTAVPTPSAEPEASGVDALRRMIAIIPQDERSRYHLPLNLVGRLLQVP